MTTGSQLTRTTFHSDQYEDIAYDSRSRVTGVTLKKSDNTTLSSQTYTYDNASQVTNHTQDSVATTYGYDDAGQLTSESRTGYSASYAYDGNGNRASKTLNGSTDTYSYDDGDKLTSVTWTGGSKTYGYDAAGRTTSVVSSAGTTTLSYDYESRVTGITYPGGATNSFSYNGLDSRVSKTDSAGTATFKRDGAYVTDPVLTDGSAAYTPGLAERRSGGTTYSHAGLKNHDRQSTTSQVVAASRQYDAFGNLTSSTGTWKGPFGYAGPFGYQEDGDSGLKLLGHRYYDPSTGRFLTRDNGKAGSNWYVYSLSHPLSRADSTGLDSLEIRYRPVISVAFAIVTGYVDMRAEAYHAYLVVTDDETGDEWVMGGEPSEQGVRGIGSRIKIYSGKYRDSNDFPKDGKPHEKLAIDDQLTARMYRDRLTKAANDMNKFTVGYNPVSGPNSNSVVRELLQRANFRPPNEHPVWVPGWDSDPWFSQHTQWGF